MHDQLRLQRRLARRGVKETGRLQKLPALTAVGRCVLDFLIRAPELSCMPAASPCMSRPARYAAHNLITSQTPGGFAEPDKDLLQSETLLAALAGKRPQELKSARKEAHARGPK
ncbi:GSU2403 family nucleotidyltransferase fold protein [Bradyrhizobium sp. 33ap4]|uniref:GSU2403 family nucleotidyltransferase fold protein n=1 Tax=Bradyrhizobium sp. 33ap4 TaxID=3061630 RepID=UPI00292EADC4|nr:GSU2403 family nucleotidyltransferase fold protein [Bradyrhizobium sp. 33ap4]